MMRRINWKALTVPERTDEIMMLQMRHHDATGALLARHFRNISATGLITHCWRSGPDLANARKRRHSRRLAKRRTYIRMLYESGKKSVTRQRRTLKGSHKKRR